MESFFDRLVLGADQLLRTLAGPAQAHRPSPARTLPPDAALEDTERRHAAGLMRVNHTGEVCAQALYRGQALTARDPAVRRAMESSAREEQDHLAWCAERLDELHARPSVLNPVFFGVSFAMGALTGLAGDRVSLGFVHATEDRVVAHLDEHRQRLPEGDSRSRAIIEQMREDEARHGETALAVGGVEFPAPVRGAMAALSKVMTETVYRI
ncbi:MAG: 2-polyprenyl-3-methyl-6-methoxy-1,4-benzoquinone monooxygenase [Pseudomonadales bacterium]|jgi:ubiquinone biosynthesis monooxygenase Coq7|nr:2-polyprenyl-3-methyl-6-methoxy-1,4-benzoquinone monooxygenase [Pseudomonadales bacterium]